MTHEDMMGMVGASAGFTNIYTSDFTVDEDGFLPFNSTPAGDIDAIDGQDDCLRITVDAALGNHYAYKSSFFTAGKYYRVRFSYYNPSTNSHVDRFKVNDGLNNIVPSAEVLDAWTNIDVYHTATSTTVRFYALDGGTSQFQDPGGDDVFYIKGIIVDEYN